MDAQEPDEDGLRELYKTMEFIQSAARIWRRRTRAAVDARLSAACDPEELECVAGGDSGGRTGGGGGGRDDVGNGGRAVRRKTRRRSVALGDAIPERATVAHDIKTFVRRFGDVPESDARRDAVWFSPLGGSGRAAIWPSLAERYLEHALEADPGGAGGCGAGDLIKSCGRRSRRLGLAELYETIDLPLVRVLARDGRDAAIRWIRSSFGVLSGRMEEEIARLVGRDL